MTTSSNNSQSPLPASGNTDRHWSPSMVISIVTGPFLLGLLGAQAIAESLTQLGLASEELFRGERLPTLQNIPEASPQNNFSDSE